MSEPNRLLLGLSMLALMNPQTREEDTPAAAQLPRRLFCSVCGRGSRHDDFFGPDFHICEHCTGIATAYYRARVELGASFDARETMQQLSRETQ